MTFKKKNSNVLDYQQEEESAAMFGGYMRAGDIPEGSRVVKSFKIDPNMPDTAKAALQRISANHNQNDYGLAENQMRILTELPWTDMADLPRAKVNIKIAEQKLDSRLLGEEKAKARILEQIALSNRSFKAPIKPLIFVGPPGTGKTFTAKLVAEIRGVPAEVISFPAVCESWEIMGSNKGWNNSDAGYITKSLVKHKRVPCFIFDEIDKAEQGNPQRTPPIRALSSILEDDRSSFIDPYIEVPYSLKHAVIIMTANDLNEIPPPLKSRSEIIYFKGLKGQDERRTILEQYIYPKLYEMYMLTTTEFTPSAQITDYILSNSEESGGGVREMQKKAEIVFTRAVYLLERDELDTIQLDFSDLGDSFRHNLMFSLTANL